MTYGYSDDLRKSCLSYYAKSGKPQKEVALMFGIGLKTLSNWIRHSKQGFTSLRREQKARHCPKLDEGSLRAYIGENPDAYLCEIAEHFDVSIPAVHYAFKRLGILRNHLRVGQFSTQINTLHNAQVHNSDNKPYCHKGQYMPLCSITINYLLCLESLFCEEEL